MPYRDNNEYYYINIRNKLNTFVETIRRDSSLNLQSLNVLAETFFAQFLSLLHGWELENANGAERNAKGIDLIDRENKVVVQVSSTTTHDKIQRSLNKCSQERYRGFHFYFVAIANSVPNYENFTVPDGVSFDQRTDIFYAKNMLERIQKLVRDSGIEKKQALSELMDRYFEPNGLYELYRYLGDVLNTLRKEHPSFTLMRPDKIDDRLFPNAVAIQPFETKGTLEGDKEPRPVWERIVDSWKGQENRSVYIEGEGGIGKTVTLLSPPAELPTPALYIQLYKLVRDGKCLSVTDWLHTNMLGYAEAIDRLAMKEWKNGPSMLLLLDGINEIPALQRSSVLNQLISWRETHPGAQLIAVTRPLDEYYLLRKLGDPIHIRLESLSEETVLAYLRECGLDAPTEGIPKDNVLRRPLFLTLYAKSGRITHTEAEGYPLAFLKARSKGAIIWNYLQRELLRFPEEGWVLHCAVACEYFLPLLAHDMLERYEFEIRQDRALKLIQDASDSFDPQRLPKHLSVVWQTHFDLHYEYPNLSAVDWNVFIFQDLGLLLPKGDGKEKVYTFPHQIFRDCLAGLHLVNQAEAAREEELPEEWRQTPNHLALDYVAELMDRNTAQKLWEANRQQKPTIRASTCAMLELQKRLPEGKRSELDFSSMDLRGLSLTRYCGQDSVNLGLFRKPEYSRKTRLNADCFRGQGHSGEVEHIAVTEDGLCVSGSKDGTLRVWDIHSGDCLHTLAVHTDKEIHQLTVTDNGLCAIRSYDNIIQVWDIRSGLFLHKLRVKVCGHVPYYNVQIAITPNGLCVCTDGEKTLYVMDLRTGKRLFVIREHGTKITCVKVTKDNLCISASSDGAVKVWNLKTGKCIRVFSEHTDEVTNLAVTTDNTCVSVSKDGTMRVWNLLSGNSYHTWHIDIVYQIAVTKCGLCISFSETRPLDSTPDAVWDCLNKTYKTEVWDIYTGERLYIHEEYLYSQVAHCLAVTDDGLCIDKIESFYSESQKILVWDMYTGNHLYEYNEKNQIVSMAVTKEGLSVSGHKDGTIKIWDTRSHVILHEIGRNSIAVTGVSVNKYGFCVSGSEDSLIRVWNIRSSRLCRRINVHKDSIKCVATTDVQCISGSMDETLCVCDIKSGELLYKLEGHAGSVNCIALTDEGCCISGSADKTLRIWDLQKRSFRRKYKGHSEAVNCVAISDDGLCVSGSDDRTLRVWEIASRRFLHELKWYSSQLRCVTTSADGICVSGSADGALQLWNLHNGTCLSYWNGHDSSVNCVAAIGDIFISGSDDSRLRVWDIHSHNLLSELRGHTGPINCVSPYMDGLCVSGSSDGTIRIWKINTKKRLFSGGECLDTIRLLEVDVSGMNLSEAILEPEFTRALWQNGATLSEDETRRQQGKRL